MLNTNSSQKKIAQLTKKDSKINRDSLLKLRWSLFKNHKRGYIALILFTLVFIISLASDVIVNDKPLFILFEGRYYFPFLFDYTELELGGSFPSLADFSDIFFIEELEQKASIMIKAIFPYNYDTHVNDLLGGRAPSPPEAKHWLGTDDQARDVLARVLYGLRISILFGLFLAILSSIIGITMGLIQGFYGGLLDLIAQRFLEIWSGLPALYILIIMSSIINPSFAWLLFILLLFSWTSLVAIVRAETLKVRSYNYIRAARVMGVSELRIMIRHVLPNAMTATITFLPFLLAGSIGSLASLDFLGFGLPPGSPSLGELLLQGRNNLQAPWLAIVGFVSTGLILSLLVFVGEGLRHAIDPYRRNTIMSSEDKGDSK